LPNTRSARKEVGVASRRQIHNKAVRSRIKTEVKRSQEFISGGELDSAAESVRRAIRTLDKAAQKGTIHPNNAARRKSRLARKLNRATSSV
jgi:small subunit ribosomal protein S20